MATRHFRAHQRFVLKEAVIVSASGRRAVSEGTTVDLSLGGLCCELDTPLRLGEDVRVVIKKRPSNILQGSVAWIGWSNKNAIQLGIRFITSDADDFALVLDNLKLADT